MKKTITLIAVMATMSVFSQEVQDTTSNKLNEVKVESLRYKNSKKNSQQIQTIDKKEIEFGNYQTTADMLSNSGSLFVQKSQQGGGSPVIRGLESSRILLLVDGVRMNNLIYRGGHLQNVITVDENMLEKADVLFGAASTQYGSDAMGGAINLVTKRAKLYSETGKSFSANINTRYGSANEEKSISGDLAFHGKKFAALFTASGNEFGDLTMGKKQNGNYDYFGLRPQYIETVGNTDEIINNPDPYKQVHSGYKQGNAMLKLLFAPTETTSHSINLQYSTTNDIPRYDRLTDIRNEKLRFAVWNYGPQNRLLAGYKFTKDKALLNSDLSVGANYQRIEESRINRSRNSDNLDSRIENVSVYSLNVDLKAKVGNGTLLYGVEGFYDHLKSTANRTNRVTGEVDALDTRYPDGKNFSLRTDAFATYNANINENTSYNLGLRAGYTKLQSEFVNQTFFAFPFKTIEQSNITYSAAAGIVNNSTKNVKVSVNVSTGYRTPNVDDLAKVFESTTGTVDGNGRLLVPNSDIKPEKNITGDLGITLFGGKALEFDNTIFYTHLFDVIANDKFTYNGASTIEYNGFPADVYASQNLDQAYIFGYSSKLNLNLCKNLKFYGGYNYTYGRAIPKNPKTVQPLDHIPPHYGKVGFNFDSKYVTADVNMLFNGKKDIKDYSASGEDNQQYAPTFGIPSWQTYNVKVAGKPIKYVTIYAGVENILDTMYRNFASGINAAGRNVYGGLKLSY